MKTAPIHCQESAVVSTSDLLRRLDLSIDTAPFGIVQNPSFQFLVSGSYVGRMKKGDWYDPLLLQVLPRSEEMVDKEGFVADAVNDGDAQVVPGMLHKYASRVLLLVSSACAIHCRFCFRREYPFVAIPQTPEEWEPAWRYLEGHTGINEVILSGGDPLCLDPASLDQVLRRITTIPHVKIIRIHTRVPIADPCRVNDDIVRIIAEVAATKTTIIVFHANHPDEFSDEVGMLLGRLRATGSLLLSQTVLLAGINDSVDCQRKLSETLIAHGVMPYYLHQLDRVKGAWHFEVAEERGKSIIAELRNRLPGYAVPTYVREVAGEKSKTPL